jgi:hypothetical protein
MKIHVKNVYRLLLAFVLCLSGLGFAGSAESAESFPLGDFQAPPVEVFTASGRLEEANIETDPATITIRASGGTATGNLAETCVFYDEEGRAMSASNFRERYMDRTITIDFVKIVQNGESKNAIIECRGGGR